MVDLNKPIEEMTDDELLEVIKSVKAVEKDGDGGEGKKPSSDPIRVTLSDGSIVEGSSHEEVNKLLLAKLEEYRGEEGGETKPDTPPAPPTKPAWDYDKFAKTFVKDPREALDYLDTAELGFPARKVLPLILATVGQLTQKVQEMETQRFLTANEDYEPSPENRKAIEKIMQERGWQPGYQTLQDAYDIAKSRGLVKTKAKEGDEGSGEPPRRSFIPPRTRTRTKEPEPTDADLIAAAEGMDLDKLEELLLKGGVLKTRHSGAD